MTLLMLIAIPLAGAAMVAFAPERKAKWIAFWWSMIAVGAAVFAAFTFDWTRAGAFQFPAAYTWIESFGVTLRVGVDSVALMLILLTVLLGPICIAGSFTAVQSRQKLFYASLLVLQAAMTGVFASRDIVFFYLCFEFTLAPMYVLIRQWGSTNRRAAATKFFLYTFTGSILTLAGLVYVAWFNTTLRVTDMAPNAGAWTFAIADLQTAAAMMPAGHQAWVLLALLAGFAVKVPLFPVHTWLPLAHTEAPTAGSVILAGVLLKLGTYGLFRFAVPFTPQAMVAFAPTIAVICIIGILYAGLICWAQNDVKKLVAYSSVSHLGFCVLGLVALNSMGGVGSVAYMINHGLSTGALFLCIGMIYERFHTRRMDELGGLAARMPIWAFFMVFFTMASVGLPGLNGFVGEFMTMMGAFQAGALWDGGVGGLPGALGPWYGAVAASGVIIAAIYLLFMVGKIVFGPLRLPSHADGHEHEASPLPRDLSLREIGVLTPLAVACLVLGLYPTPMLRALERPVALTMSATAPYLPGVREPEIPSDFRFVPTAGVTVTPTDDQAPAVANVDEQGARR